MILNLIIAILLVWGAIQGFRQGFIKQLCTLVALILGLWAACHFSAQFIPYLSDWLSITDKWLSIVAFICVFVVVVLLVHLVGYLLEHFFKLIALGFLNRILGLFFGVLKYALFISVLICIFDAINHTFNLVSPDVMEQSSLYQIVGSVAPALFPYLQFDSISTEVDEIVRQITV